MTLTQTYVVRPIDPAVVAQLRVRDDAGRTPTLILDADGGNPVRCCLRTSRPGESLLLVSYAPLRRWAQELGVDPAAYDEVGPVFVHPVPCDGASSTRWPDELRGSRRVLRAYDANGRIVGGTLLPEGGNPERSVMELFDDERVAVVHARALVNGCFTFAVERAA